MTAFNWVFTTRKGMTLFAMIAAAPLAAVIGNANIEPLSGSSGDDLPPIVATDLTPEEAYQRGQEFFSVDTPSAQERAEKWLRSAAERGHLTAQHHLFVLLARGQFGDGELTPEAQEWLVKAAHAGSMLSQGSLGTQYFNGSAFIEKDYDKARYWFELSAAQNGAYAMINLGRMYRDGLGVEADEAKAFEYYRRSWKEADSAFAVSPGSSSHNEAAIEGMWEYARILRFSDHVYMENQLEEAVRIFRFLASDQGGSPEAQMQYGLALANGIGVEQNEYEAIRWYLKAAARGNEDAMNNLSVMFAMGRGAEKDQEASFVWALRAAREGHPIATTKVGGFIVRGEAPGDGPDYEASLSWFLLAAERGEESSEHFLTQEYGEDYRQRLEALWVKPEQLFARYATIF